MISAISEIHRKFVGLSLSFVLTNILANDSDDGVVILPPFIYEGPPQLVYFSPGDRLVLPCKGYGIPFPRFYWYHNGQPLETSNTTDALYYMQDPSINGVLHMKARPQTTQGYYHCLVVNNFGISMSNVTFLQEAVLQDLQLRRTVYNITVTEGRPLVLQCSHVISIPAATITWHTIDLSNSNPSLSMVPVRFNERIATDDNGGLVFLAITKTDVRDDLVYKCDAYNYIIRRTSGGSYYRIIVQEEPYKKDFVPELIFSSSKVIALTGTNVTLTCLFSSRPTAEIEWNRTGATLPSTAMVSDYGRKLLLKQVALADAGYYRCTASNDVGDSSSSISLVVVASPRMRNPMSNRNVTVGQSASFVCDCVGQPKPSVQWLINAQPVNFSRTQLEWEIRDNILSLNDLQLGDDAIVACNASNNYGSVLSSAYLLVHPSLTTKATDVPTTDAANITFTTEFANAETSQVQTDSTTDVQTEPNEVTLHTMATYSQTSSETESSVNYEMITTGMTTSETGSDNIFGFRAHNSDEVMNRDEVKSFKFNFISAIFFLVFFLGFFLFLAFVCHKTANKRKTYRVNEQEKKHGCSKREYDSDDSGYDEQRAERIVNRFRTMMTIDQECYL